MGRLLVDEDLPRSLARALRGAGHHATAVVDTRLRGLPDHRILAFAARQHLVVVTRDVGLAGSATRRGPTAPTVVLARLPSETPIAAVVQRVVTALREIGALPRQGTTVVISPTIVRVRTRR